MKYKAIDGTVLESKPNELVTYVCNVENITDGEYESYETTSSTSEIGIQQIKIKRIVNGNTMTIEITESSEQELIDYKNSLINDGN